MAERGWGPPTEYAPRTPFWGRSSTKHLAAGVHVDPVFRRSVLNEVFRRRHRELAPSYGFDALAVTYHARRAQTIDAVRDALLLVVQVLLIARFSALLAVWGLLFGWFQIVAVVEIVSEAAALARDGAPLRAYRRVWTRALTLFLLYFVVYLPLALLALSLSVVQDLQEFARGRTGEPEYPATTASSVFGDQLVVGVATVVVVGICVGAWVFRQRAIDRIAADADVPFGPDPSAVTELVARVPRQVVTYAGYEPFLGAGPLLYEWSFTHRLLPDLPASELRPEDVDRSPLPFTSKDVVAHLRGRFAALRDSPVRGQGLPSFAVWDGIYLSDLYSYPVPDGLLPQSEFDRIADDGYEQIRHYLVLQFGGWLGEVVTTVFVRVSVQGGMLYLDFSVRNLPPTRAEYRAIDSVSGVGAPAQWRAVWLGVRDAPKTVALAPIRLLRLAFDSASGALARGAAARSAGGRRYGPEFSIREAGSALPPYHHFQISDVERFAKVVERRLLADLIAYLRARGVDVSEFEQRVVSILNYGIQHFGNGDVSVDQSAVGTGNQVRTGGRHESK